MIITTKHGPGKGIHRLRKSRLSELMSHIKNLVTSCYLTLAMSYYMKLSNALLDFSTVSLI
ncbi:hypothetical protein I7I53_10393 [Histoplasma capsulatum var. duboisii H88]|uniref:Uncharacterized protein n=1 Tax=Ajellomyces capsulatus (strain H88) TaxID=544711 RepID=A0A8A1L8J3_AJEC8|nr:hypothetical protein I7I53_10393 [Histoplasma capsulatum var. duboisii H88]